MDRLPGCNVEAAHSNNRNEPLGKQESRKEAQRGRAAGRWAGGNGASEL